MIAKDLGKAVGTVFIAPDAGPIPTIVAEAAGVGRARAAHGWRRTVDVGHLVRLGGILSTGRRIAYRSGVEW
jgi:hypothetical protein